MEIPIQQIYLAKTFIITLHISFQAENVMHVLFFKLK